jgi:hypothetical protein
MSNAIRRGERERSDGPPSGAFSRVCRHLTPSSLSLSFLTIGEGIVAPRTCKRMVDGTQLEILPIQCLFGLVGRLTDVREQALPPTAFLLAGEYNELLLADFEEERPFRGIRRR